MPARKRNPILKLTIAAVLMVMIGAPSTHGASEGWWNDQWQYRRKINFDTTAAAANVPENLTAFPLLLRLHSGNFNFANAKEDGTDIRFVGPDDRSLLKYHIERFDSIDEIALIWVHLPKLSGQTNTDFIRMYYGNPDAAGGQDVHGTYDGAFAVIYHLDEIERPPQDSSQHKNDAAFFQGGQGMPGVIGNGFAFNGAGDRITVAPAPSLDFSSGMSFSAWVKIAQPQADAYLFSREAADGRNIVVGIDGTKLYVRVQDKGLKVETERSADLSPESWHHVAVSMAVDQKIEVWADGIQLTWSKLPGPLPKLETDIVLGDGAEGGHAFIGDMDEIQISGVARPGALFRAVYASQGLEASLVSYNVEVMGEGGGGMPVFYLKTIFENITLDGMVVIGLLGIFSLLSWIVFLSKAGTLWMTGRSNRRFLDFFNELEDPVALEQVEGEFPNSNLCRIYRAGCTRLAGISGRGGEDGDIMATIGAKEMNVFKASLEKGFVMENKRLNSWLVFLTMAISGGPFLGLLGTIWGVMNTFAAMAEAGEANIMAIAPGVASALSTTVFGLLVAIPALFAYNFLATQVKSITADLTVFIDEFTVRVDTVYGELS